MRSNKVDPVSRRAKTSRINATIAIAADKHYRCPFSNKTLCFLLQLSEIAPLAKVFIVLVIKEPIKQNRE